MVLDSMLYSKLATEFKVMYASISGITVNIEWLDPNRTTELGLSTVKNGDTYIMINKQPFNTESQEEQLHLIEGIFAHELLHLVLTDFKSFKYQLGLLDTPGEKEIFRLIFNIIEDTAIEYFSPTVFGGRLQTALRYTRAKVYKNSPEISTLEGQFGQYIAALLQFGSMGKIKGCFTTKAAHDAYYDTIGLFCDAIHMPLCADRLVAARTIFLNTKNLWQDIANSKNKIAKIKKYYGREVSEINAELDGRGKKGTQHQTDEENNAELRRKKTDKLIKKMKKEIERVLQEYDEKEAEKRISAIKEKADKINASITISKKEYQLTEEVKTRVKSSIDQINSEIKKEKEDYSFNCNNDFALSETKVSCMNMTVKLDADLLEEGAAYYDRVIKKHSQKINTLIRHLRNLFSDIIDDRIRKSSGRIDPIRAYMPTSSRIFYQRVENERDQSFAVTILIDESGSMKYENRIDTAREAVICLVEAFCRLRMPLYVMGYTTCYTKVQHRHYVQWNCNRLHKASLKSISTYQGNRDGYSIRYAANILSKHKANNKLLIIINDGLPQAEGYINAIKDTEQAIKEAKKITSVLGCNIGDEKTSQELRTLYGRDFIEFNNMNEFFSNIIRAMQKVID